MINLPSENLKLPSDLKKQVDNVRNSIVLLDAEANNLKKICASERYTIGELSKKKIELNDIISDLESKIKLESEKFDLIQKSYLDKLKELESVNKKFMLLSEDIETFETNKNKATAELEEKEYKLNIRENDISLKENNIVYREVELNKKEQKLKDFILTL